MSWTRRDLVGLSPSSDSSHPSGIGDNLVLMSYGSGDPSVTSRILTIPPGQGYWHTASLSAQNGTRYLVGSQQLPLPMTSRHAGRGRASGLLACWVGKRQWCGGREPTTPPEQLSPRAPFMVDPGLHAQGSYKWWSAWGPNPQEYR